MAQEKRIFAADALQTFCSAVLKGANLRPDEADIIAESLVYADLRGVGSHGLIRLETYLDRVEHGLMNLEATMPILNETPAAALIDAENGFGQVAGVKAMDLAVKKAASVGVGFISVKNSNHYGVSAYYAKRATDNNMAAIVFTNAGPAMNPYGGTEPLLGTNPFASAVPVKGEEPMILDMATTEVARGKLRKALANGESIPLGWAVDKNGNPTTDAKTGLEGTLCPMGGPKGSGLSLMIDLFTGVLSGSALTGDAKGVTAMTGVSRVGHMFLAINPAFFSGTETFLTDTAAVAKRIHGQKAASGSKVYLPGEIEAENEAKNRANGVALTDNLIEILNGCAKKYGASELR
ncbi:MAG: putative oxidoreductase YjmC [Desulfovibrio sp.]